MKDTQTKPEKSTTKWWKPLSLTKKLTLLIVVAYLVPLLSMITLLQQFIAEQYDQQVLSKVDLSLEETTGLAVTYLESIIEASRRLTYDGSVDEAYRAYLETGNSSALYQWTQSSLNSVYRYNSLLLSAGLFFDDDDLPQHVLNNDGSSMDVTVKQNYLVLEDKFREISQEIGPYIGFYSQDNQLFLLRNLWDFQYQQYGLLVLEVNIGRVLGAFQGITGVYAVEISYDDALVSLGNMTEEKNHVKMSYKTGVERYTLNVTLGVDTSQGEDTLGELTQRVFQVSTLIIPSLGYMLFSVSRHVTQPLKVLLASQKEVEKGELGFQVESIPSSREFESLTLGFNAMSRSMKEQFQQSYEEQLALQDAKMKTLQSQINPHFLNNTLEIINWETRIAGNTNASSMIEALSVMLGATMDREGKGKIPFHQELTYVDAYLYIQSCRMGARLEVVEEIDPSLMDCLVPRLAFQPIVENAFEHGIASQKKGKIIISNYIEEGILILEVRNTGILQEKDRTRIAQLLAWDEETQNYAIDSPSLGVRNVNQRVKLMYGQAFGLEIDDNDQGETVARLSLPFQTEESDDTNGMNRMDDINGIEENPDTETRAD